LGEKRPSLGEDLKVLTVPGLLKEITPSLEGGFNGSPSSCPLGREKTFIGRRN
jgi:hypothetical protein